MASQKVILNMPIDLPVGQDREALMLSLPRVGDCIAVDGVAYRVGKVLHPVARRGVLLVSRPPVVYLTEPREQTESERSYIGPELSPVPDPID